MSLALLHRQCSREINGTGPSPLPETASEMSNESAVDEMARHAKPSTQVGRPPALPTGGCPAAAAAAAPPWLLSTLADLNEKMGWLAMNNPEQDDMGETFAQRAESYYQKRPQLLAFLRDLYRGYISLSERYIQLLSKNNRAHHSRQSSQVSTITTENDFCSLENDHREELSDAESSLFFQLPLHSNRSSCELFNLDALVAEIVIKNVECDILLNEAEISGRRSDDASRKIELQRSLLEVLESERLILLNENARLGYRVGALIEENRELAAESVFVKKKAGEMARCILKMREDQRVCALSRKIEDLQGQIHGLEKRNREYYEQIVRRDLEAEAGKRKMKGKSGSWARREVALEVCFQVDRFKMKPSLRAEEGKKLLGWWEKLKKMDIFMCGMMPTDHGC